MRLKLALLGVVLLGTTATAEAYPQFQFTTGNSRCSNCHFAPAGGGLINNWGRMEAADTISRGGDGAFLHGLWDPPKSFRMGGDYRAAFIAKDTWEEPEYLGFPMQVDFYGLGRVGDFSLAVTVGMRGAARSPRDSVLTRLISREHYVMWNERKGPYVRVGRFMPVYGLRLQDHTSYVRRFLGLHTLEESYGIGVGKVEGDWEVHATAFVPPPILGVSDDSGGAVYYERRLGDDAGAVGAQAKVTTSPHDNRYFVGGVGKWYLDGADLLFLAELDAGLQTIPGDPDQTRGQLAGYLGATWIPLQGLMVGAALERFDQDLTLSGSERDAASVTLQYFPRAHWELMLLGKLEAQGADYGEPSELAMFMLHYYL